jgi:hypothetical protein
VKKRIGQILVEAGVIDQFQLQSALGYQKQWGGRLGDVLVDKGFVKEARLVQALSQQLGMSIANLRELVPEPKTLEMVPRELCEKLRVFPVEMKGQGRSETLVLAMVDPTDLAALDQIAFTTRKRVSAVLAGKSELDAAIERHYRGGMPAEIDLTTGRYQSTGSAAQEDDGDLLSSIEPIAATVGAPPPVADAILGGTPAPAEEDLNMTIEPIAAGLQDEMTADAVQKAVADMDLAGAAPAPAPASPPPIGDSLFEGLGLESESPPSEDLAMELELPAEAAAAGAAAWRAEREAAEVAAAEAAAQEAVSAQAAAEAEAQAAADAAAAMPAEAAPLLGEAAAPHEEEDIPDIRISTKDLTELVDSEPEAEAPPETEAPPAEAPAPEFAEPAGGAAAMGEPVTEPPPEERLDALSAELDALATESVPSAELAVPSLESIPAAPEEATAPPGAAEGAPAAEEPAPAWSEPAASEPSPEAAWSEPPGEPAPEAGDMYRFPEGEPAGEMGNRYVSPVESSSFVSYATEASAEAASDLAEPPSGFAEPPHEPAPPPDAAPAPEAAPPPETAAPTAEQIAGNGSAAVGDPIGALVRLLIRKGLFTEEEWLEELGKQ